MNKYLTDEQLELDKLLHGLSTAAEQVRHERYGKNVAVKPETVDLLVGIARIHLGELPSVWLHQLATALDAERAAHQTTQAELDRLRKYIRWLHKVENTARAVRDYEFNQGGMKRHVHVKLDEALYDLNAARTGQGEGAE